MRLRFQQELMDFPWATQEAVDQQGIKMPLS